MATHFERVYPIVEAAAVTLERQALTKVPLVQLGVVGLVRGLLAHPVEIVVGDTLGTFSCLLAQLFLLSSA